MNDFMDDFNTPVTPQQPAEPLQNSNADTSYYNEPVNSGYSYQQKADNVYTAADVYDLGRLPDNNNESVVLELVKATLGAVVGALPGLILWILIGKVGFVAAICGSILAMGTIAGYTFMTKDNYFPQKYGVIICIAVIVIAVFMAEKVVWCWELSDQFKVSVTASKEAVYALGDAGGLTTEEMDQIFNESIREEFGFTEGTFGDFFSNFNRTIRYLGLSTRYYIDLLMSYGFAFLGGFSLFKKFAR